MQSGLKVNESKTEICFFHQKDQPMVVLTIRGTQVLSKQAMNIQGVSFDSKLNWQIQVQKAITNSRKALHILHLIQKILY